MMNKKEIFKKVGGIITELNEQYEYLSQSPENLNELELELFSANANFLSDHISILVKINGNSNKSSQPEAVKTESAEQDIETKSEIIEEKPAAERPEEKKLEDISNWRFEIEKEPIESYKPGEIEEENPHNEKEEQANDESSVKAEDNIKEEEKVEEPEEEQEEERIETEEDESDEKDEIEEPAEPVQEASSEESIVKEVVISERTVALPVEQTTPDTPAPTINDLLSKNAPQQTIGSQFNSRQVKDLKSMISLNDKLLFVRDLFNGYSLAYSEAIELLNRFDRMEAAENFLKQNYASKNNWANKQEVADKFHEILERRFSK